MMKTQVQCASCGLNNKASQLNCIRCYASLDGLPVSTVVTESPGGFSIPLWLKLSAGGAVLVVLLVAAAAFTLVLSARKAVARRYAHLENAVRISPDFSVPVSVDVGRYTYRDMDTAKSEQEATPAAYTLAQLGLIYIHTGMYSDTPAPVNSFNGRVIIDPNTGLAPQAYRHVSLEAIGNGQAQSANWEPYENKKQGAVGWKVPVGERELLRIVQVMAVPDGVIPSSRDTSESLVVSFTWKWKPNELGKSFDKGSPSYVTPATPKNFSRSSFDVEINDSRATYWGTAQLHRTGDTWEAGQMSWHGPGGIKLASNDSAEIDRIIRQAQNPR
jgi:hypothetical protein